MSKNNTDETLEVYSEFAKHLLKISNRNNLLHLSLTNVNTGLYFEDVFNLEKLNKLGNSSNFSSIDSIEKTLYQYNNATIQIKDDKNNEFLIKKNEQKTLFKIIGNELKIIGYYSGKYDVDDDKNDSPLGVSITQLRMVREKNECCLLL